MKLQRRYIGLLAIVLLNGLLLASCDSNVQPDQGNDTDDPGTPGNTNDPDRFAEYLVLTDASKLSGALPTAPDLGLKISVKDTLFLVKDFPYGARVVVRHDGQHDISGFYVGVSNSSFYYDVPVDEREAQDSTDVIYINLAAPDGDDVDYPLAIPIKIIPHGPDGSPLDEFEKVAIVEDPATSNCPITIPSDPQPVHWVWEFTVGLDFSGQVFQVDAPGLKQINRYQTGGCCNADGTSSTVANDPTCFSEFSDGTPNPRWRTIDVEHYFTWGFDLLWLFDDRTFHQWNHSHQTNYRPSKSDFCKNVAAYDFEVGSFDKTGIHDYAPGANYLNIEYDETDPPVFGKIIGSGDILYTCRSLILTIGREEKWSLVYRKYLHDFNPVEFGRWE